MTFLPITSLDRPVELSMTDRVRRLSDYATPEEIATLRTDLQARWDEKDRVLSKPAPGRRRNNNLRAWGRCVLGDYYKAVLRDLDADIIPDKSRFAGFI